MGPTPFTCMLTLTVAYVVQTAGSTVYGQSAAVDTETASASFRVYSNNWPLAQQAFAEGDYKKALIHYEKVAKVLPYEPSCRFEIARCQVRLGKPETAIRTLSSAVEYGWSHVPRLEATEEFQGLAQNVEFQRVAEAMNACNAETIVAYEAASVDKKTPAGLIIYLHGLGCGPRSEMPYWHGVADTTGYIVVAPRAPTKLAPMLYGWQRADARDSSSDDFFDIRAAKQCIEDAVRFATGQFSIDHDRMILAGFSQGGGVALRYFGEAAESFLGTVAIGSLCQPMGGGYWRDAKRSGGRALLMAGEYDPLMSRSQAIAEELTEAGVNHRFLRLAKTGHEYPVRHEIILLQAVRFVSER